MQRALLLLLVSILCGLGVPARADDEVETVRARVLALLDEGDAAAAREILAPRVEAARREDRAPRLDALLALAARVARALGDVPAAEAATRERLELDARLALRAPMAEAVGDGAAARRLHRARLDLAIAREDVHGLLDAARDLFATLRRHAQLDAMPAAYAHARGGLPPEAREAVRFDLLDRFALASILAGRPGTVEALLREGLARARTVGEEAWVGVLHTRLGRVQQEQNAYAEARRHFAAALAIARERGDTYEQGRAETLLGFVALGTRDHETAIVHLKAALAIWREHGPRVNIGRGLLNLAAAYSESGAWAKARAGLEEAIGILDATGDAMNAGRTRLALAGTFEQEGRFEDAVRASRLAFEIAQRTGDATGEFSARISLARLARLAGRPEAGLAHLAAARRVSGDIGGWSFELVLRAEEAHNAAARGRPDEAETLAAEAIPWLARAARGHADRDAATVRTRFAPLFTVGTLAAQQQGHVEQVLAFLESGRALLIGEALARGPHARHALVTPELAAREARAQEAERRAYERWVRAERRGRFQETRAARAALREARAALDAVIAEMRREHRAAAGVLYPEPVTLAELRASLAPGTVLVVFGTFAPEQPGVALVVRSSGAEVIRLTDGATLEARCAAVQRACRSPGADPAAARAALREVLVVPLGLRDDDLRVLVSPAGALATLPWSYVLRERSVAVLPSATTYLGLASVHYEGAQGVLGLGRPDYVVARSRAARQTYAERGGSELVDLPATAEEVAHVADVRLLGREATEAGLARALRSRPAWRAVHLACHGLVDADEPMRSSLAVTATATEDGLLTAGEVLRLPFHADLVSLSACETARGKVVWGEGTLGLAQAFMIAGARSVLCSVWSVDDEATRALMTRFYDLWHPRDGRAALPAPEALRAAQAFVREHDAWRHPYYWAAWTLWGPGR